VEIKIQWKFTVGAECPYYYFCNMEKTKLFLFLISKINNKSLKLSMKTNMSDKK